MDSDSYIKEEQYRFKFPILTSLLVIKSCCMHTTPILITEVLHHVGKVEF